jgi:hypothetical protein
VSAIPLAILVLPKWAMSASDTLQKATEKRAERTENVFII